MNKQNYTCGLGPWRPGFLQRFANTKTFIVVYGLLGTIQAMGFIYFVATLTTLEKRFQIPSQTTGILMSGNEISQIILSLYLSYRGGKGNRPLWISWGVTFSAISCFILASPHFFYGAGENALALTKEFLDLKMLNTSVSNTNVFMCSGSRTVEGDCLDIRASEILPLVLVFMSQFVLGVGTTLYYSLGQTYMDDNTKKTNTPMLLGITMALRTAGPAVGFALGFACLSTYIDPSLTPLIEREDPRWLGAWWLGWIILGSVMLFLAVLLAMFPKDLKPSTEKKSTTKYQESTFYEPPCDQGVISDSEEEDSLYTEFTKQNGIKRQANGELTKEPEFENMNQHFYQKIDPNFDSNGENSLLRPEGGFGNAMKRLLKNKVLMCNNMTTVFYILGASGYITFFNKYIEAQYHASAARANMTAGTTTIFGMVIGFIISGYVISRWKPRTSYLLMWNVLTAFVYVLGEVIYMTLGCEEDMFQGNIINGSLDSWASCNADCSCDSIKYTPVCSEKENRSFFSACHAGCQNTFSDDVGKILHGNCSCLNDITDVVRPGICNVDCGNNFHIFLIVCIVIQLFGCTGKITNVLVNYRSVEQRDKALAQGLALFMISLLAFIPGPIIFGRIIDSTCLVWDNSCGKQGNCWLYDKQAFRISLNTTAAVFTTCAFFLDILLWYFGRHMKIYEDEEDKTIKRKE